MVKSDLTHKHIA